MLTSSLKFSFVLCAFAFGLANSQSLQLIVSSPASVAGRYAAATFNASPGLAFSPEPTAIGSLVVYDEINCITDTFVKPVQPTVAGGKAALLMTFDPATCRTYDDIVRTLQRDGVIAVILVSIFGNPTVLTHTTSPFGVVVPTLIMFNSAAALEFRKAIVSGEAVRASFVTPGQLTTRIDSFAIKPSNVRRFMANAIPATGQSIDFSSVDLIPSSIGVQQNIVAAPGNTCPGMRSLYDPTTRTITVAMPAFEKFSATCAIPYLVRDSAGNEIASQLNLLVNLPKPLSDIARTTINTPIDIDVLGNDIGDEATKVASRIDLNVATEGIDQKFSSPQLGTVEVIGGKVRYSPATGYAGTFSANYRIAGEFGNYSPVGTIVITVAADIGVTYQGTSKLAREFYLPERDTYFLTADNDEANFVASGGAGAWVETSNTFQVGGNQQVCRFYGNTAINPATNAIYGPSSHFYTIDAGECASLKSAFSSNTKSWKFESNDFFAIPTGAGGSCPAGTTAVYRMYNDGFPTKDSNHRYSPDTLVIIPMLKSGWKYENAAFCIPSR